MAIKHTNLAFSTVATAPSPTTSGTSLVVASGHGARFPSLSAGDTFRCVVCPTSTKPSVSNAEIIYITARSTDTFTITRGEEGTTPRDIQVGDDIFLTPTASEFDGFLTDMSITASPASDHSVSGIKTTLTATANVNFGDVCYIASTGKATLVDADAIASGIAVAMCADATINADASGNWLLFGVARDDTWNWTVGGLIYISTTGTTGNTLTQTAPTGTDDVVLPVGVALTADIMIFKPGLVAIEHA